MPLLVPGLVEAHSKKDAQINKTDKDEKAEEREPKPKSTTQSTANDKPKADAKTKTKTFDGRTAPGMEGMSEEAIRQFEEAMELEYQKREGGA